jgi:hypothetical protein
MRGFFFDTFLILARQALHFRRRINNAASIMHGKAARQLIVGCHFIECAWKGNEQRPRLPVTDQKLRLFKSGKFAENPSSNLFESQ